MAQQRHYDRHDPGRALGFADVRRRFGLRSVRLGRWVTTAERDRAAVAFHDALCDLMRILDGNATLIGLRGTLSLEYGLGGRPGVAAHYQPDSRALALAKNAGAGSIAHEWFHAFDHYIADKAFGALPAGIMGSRAWMEGRQAREHPLNERLMRCYRAALLSADGQRPSELFQASARADHRLQQWYYSQPEEVCARAFEAFVEDGPLHNAFLVLGSRHSQEARAGLYPQEEERGRIRTAFADYFQLLSQALRHSATRVAMASDNADP